MSVDAVLRVDLRDAIASEPERQRRFEADLRTGLADTGFVRVAGHGLDPGLIDAAHQAFARFFALDEEEKQRCGGVAGGQRGYTPFGIEHAKDAREPDPKEFFHVGQAHPEPGHRTDAYPENVWPMGLPELREHALALYQGLEQAAVLLLRAIARAWALEEERLASMIRAGNSILRAAHYPAVSSGARPGASSGAVLRAAPHEDINLITLLCEATDGGLELMNRDGEWVEVLCAPDEVVVDVGDMLSRITNDTLPSTPHRVVARGAEAERSRYALPFFAHPRPDCLLEVLPAFVAEGASPRFPPTTAQDFLSERLREIGLVS